ncbi:septal ring lytic transglycosylase RlpA family protein [uncultured Bradyrhizobium sp.]|uniref:septal ring lytic transglycosylase RlpA family protein n=2 Tax=Bradyrhizobium TaxID=374 RepID=UPI003433E91D
MAKRGGKRGPGPLSQSTARPGPRPLSYGCALQRQIDMSCRAARRLCGVGLVSAWLIAPPAHSRGFDWFFAHTRKPQSPCSGQHIVASFYSLGRRTANGEVIDVSGLTAAHRTLPFGSRVTLMNPENGKSVTVIINDRGPFARGVTIDLTRGAARALDMHQTKWLCML